MAKKKVYVEEVYIPIWRQAVSFYIADTIEDCAKAAEKQFPGTSLSGDPKFYSGCVLTLTDNDNGLKYFIVMLSVNKDTKDQIDQILVHECVHAAWRVLDSAGVDLTADNHEALAYLTEFLFEHGQTSLKNYSDQKKIKK